MMICVRSSLFSRLLHSAVQSQLLMVLLICKGEDCKLRSFPFVGSILKERFVGSLFRSITSFMVLSDFGLVVKLFAAELGILDESIRSCGCGMLDASSRDHSA